MAINLFDSINQAQGRMSQEAQSGAISAGEQGEQARRLLRLGETGREAGVGGGPRRSSLAEQVESQGARLELGRVAEDAQMALQAEEQEADIQRRADAIQSEALEERRLGIQEQFLRQTQAIMQQYRNQERELDLRKDKARTEQMGLLLRLNNQEYLRRLQAEAAKERLLTKRGMDEAIARTVFAEELDLLQSDLSFRALLGQKARDAAEQLAQIDLSAALALAEASNKQASQRQMWEGVGGLVSGGIQAASLRAPGTTQPDRLSAGGRPDEPSPLQIRD